MTEQKDLREHLRELVDSHKIDAQEFINLVIEEQPDYLLQFYPLDEEVVVESVEEVVEEDTPAVPASLYAEVVVTTRGYVSLDLDDLADDEDVFDYTMRQIADGQYELEPETEEVTLENYTTLDGEPLSFTDVADWRRVPLDEEAA